MVAMSNAAAAVALADAVAEVPAHDHVDEAAADLEVESDNGRNDGGEDGRDTFGRSVADADEPGAAAVPVVANPAGHGGEPGPVALPMPPPRLRTYQSVHVRSPRGTRWLTYASRTPVKALSDNFPQWPPRVLGG